VSALADAPRSPLGSAPKRAVPSTLLVADPAFDPREYPELSRLSAAAGEVDTIAGEYHARGAAVRELGGAGATREAVAPALRGSAVVHYAGHAVFDDDRPERSFLVLAAAGDGGPASRLTAGEISGMDLRGVRLVVLSACQTARSTPGRAGGFAGLAGGFLAAGAGGVVGSLWRVDDRLTRALMREFHRAYLDTGDAAGALRAAQLQLLHSTDPTLRTPTAWAAFRYAGR
jgi:CHAT domain-containing protein